jgi:hypothetical protein
MENANTTVGPPSLFRGSGTGTMCKCGLSRRIVYGVMGKRDTGPSARAARFRLAIVHQRNTDLGAGIAASI